MSPSPLKINIKIPTWMPQSYRDLAVESMMVAPYLMTTTQSERRVLRKYKPIKTSEWAEKYRVVTESDIPGPWRNTVTPYLVEIMDAADHPCVQTVILCKCVQSGGSEAVHNCIAKRMDRQPGPAMYVYPVESAGKKQLKKRIVPTFLESPRLRKLMTDAAKDKTNVGLTLKGGSIAIAWAHSPTSLASDPMRYVVFDEVDKYPVVASKTESDPISLGEKRTTTYRRRNHARIWKLSTPSVETGPVWVALNNEAQVIFDYWAKCPECGRHQRMVFSQIKWPGGSDADAEEVESKLMAWYECEHCQAKWDDETRNRAVRAGEWRSRGQFPMTVSAYMKNYGPKKVGFHLPAWVSFFVSLSESAAAFIRGQRDRVKLRDFANNYAAEPWKSVVVTTEFEDILSCRTELKPMTVPQRAVALTCGIDVQKHGFWFVVRAWARDYTSWLIDYGYLFTWEDVDKLLWKKRYPVDGMQFEAPIWRAAIDTGGGQYNTLMSSTEETYLWLQSRLGMGGCKAFGVKGASRPLPKKVRIGEPLSRTPSGVPLKAGMRHIQIDTGQLKSLFHERLELAVDQLPGGAYLNADVKEDYVKQILSEQKVVDEKGVERWELKKGKANHLLDCEVMASVVADWEWSGHGVEQFREPVTDHDEGTSEGK